MVAVLEVVEIRISQESQAVLAVVEAAKQLAPVELETLRQLHQAKEIMVATV